MTHGILIKTQIIDEHKKIKYLGIDLSNDKQCFQVFYELESFDTTLIFYIAIIHSMMYIKKQGMNTCDIYCESVDAIDMIKNNRTIDDESSIYYDNAKRCQRWLIEQKKSFNLIHLKK